MNPTRVFFSNGERAYTVKPSRSMILKRWLRQWTHGGQSALDRKKQALRGAMHQKQSQRACLCALNFV
jgi:hypothetical protein